MSFDGFADVIVSAAKFDHDRVDEGRVLLFAGSAGGPASTPFWTRDGHQAFAYLGWSVASAGDVDGDGTLELIVGAPGFDNGQAGEGRAYLLR